MGIVLNFDLPTWKTMRMLRDDNKWMSSQNGDYRLAISKNNNCIRSFIEEAYNEAA